MRIRRRKGNKKRRRIIIFLNILCTLLIELVIPANVRRAS
jgi:hypothetical protein